MRFWEQPTSSITVMLNRNRLPPRRLNLTDLDSLGNMVARTVVAAKYDVFALWNKTVPIQLTELQDRRPEELSFQIRATADAAPESAAEPVRRIAVNFYPQAQAYIYFATVQQQEVDQVTAHYGTLGKRVGDRSWRIPAGFLLLVAAVLAPLVVLWARGQLTLWLIPFVMATAALAVVNTSSLISRRVLIARQRQAAAVIDFRPIRQIRFDTEERRQRRNVALIFGSITAVVGAAVGAILGAVLSHGR